MQLEHGSRVLIIGGGPAGSFAALHLLRFAAEIDLRLEITIFEPRDFNRPGPGGCNKCAGILSSSLVKNLENLALELPAEIIQTELEGYILHLGKNELCIRSPTPTQHIFSVYRGSGPRLGPPPHPHSFDGWLQAVAQERGVTIRKERVRAVRVGKRPVVVTARQELEADLVILASGVNSHALLDPAWHYKPPRTEMMAQDEIHLPERMQANQVHIFREPPPGLVFGALIPKGRYANISLLGHNLPPDAVQIFLDEHNLTGLSPDGAPFLCGCTPRLPVSPARGCFADRMVTVGDAAVTRLYKDGIGASFLTAQAAAQTAIQRGVSKNDFAAGYQPTCREIAIDNSFGRALFHLWSLARRIPNLVETWRRAIHAEMTLPTASQIHRRILWGIFTGDESYRTIFWLLFSPYSLLTLWQNAWKLEEENE